MDVVYDTKVLLQITQESIKIMLLIVFRDWIYAFPSTSKCATIFAKRLGYDMTSLER